MSFFRIVHLINAWASLLSGDLADCLTPDDPSCEGGMAAVSAHARRLVHPDEPALIVPRLDKTSAFVQMHPLGWSVNRIVLRDLLGWTVFTSTPSLLTAHGDDFGVSKADLTPLQSEDLPFLLTNVVLPPTNSWHFYTEAVHFDAATGLAVLSISDSGQTFNGPQIGSALGTLDFVAQINRGCSSNEGWSSHEHNAETVLNVTSTPQLPTTCWVPVILYADTDADAFREFLSAVTEHRHPPALVVGMEMNSPLYEFPISVGYGNTWVVSYSVKSSMYYQHRITLASDEPGRIHNVTLFRADMGEMPEEYKDSVFASHVAQLRALADEASKNDPIVGSTSSPMPAARVQEGNYRRCKGGECEIGNLFADALRWRAVADVAFISSGGVRGPGWDAGDVRVSDVWASLPYPNTLCTGIMSGVSLFRALNYSIATATFQSADTTDGGRLLQVSGMKIVYNTMLEGSSRILAVNILESEEYVPIQRLRMYSFATDSYLCGVYDPFPSLLGDLTVSGEKSGIIGDLLHQNIVGEFLTQMGKPYDNTIQGRLRNDTVATDVLNLVQTEEDCALDSFWIEEKLSCMPCSNISNVAFSDERVAVEVESGVNTNMTERVILVNREVFPVSIQAESLPSWARLTGNTSVLGGLTSLASGESVAVKFTVDTSSLEEGTAQGSISFQVLDRENSRRCVSHRASFEVFVRIQKAPDNNYLGSTVTAVGLTLMFIVIVTSTFFALWVLNHRKLRIVASLQPDFLMTICLGVLVMASAVLPLSVDESMASVRGCNIACMASPWLMTMGLTVAFSSLFSKLWRINKLFGTEGRMRRMQVKQRVFFVIFSILFTLNCSFLLTWNLVDPLRWTRLSVDGEVHNTYGSCTGSGSVSTAMLALVVAVNVCSLLLCVYEAYKARSISSEFSESTYLWVALYSWLQLALVGIPVRFMIDDGNPSAKYFLEVALLFAVSMSMLLIVFTPILKKLLVNSDRGSTRSGNVHISGIHTEPSVQRSAIIASNINMNGSIQLGSVALNSTGGPGERAATIRVHEL